MNTELQIVFLDTGTLYDVPNLSILDTLGQVTYYHNTLPAETAARISEADVIITNKVIVGASEMHAAKRLKLICVAATGTNNIDLNFAKNKGIQVKNVAGYATHSVAQITWAMILNLHHRIMYYHHFVTSGAYSKHAFFTHIGMPFDELKGKKLGIIGMGAIGRAVSALASAFGIEVFYTSLSGTKRAEPYPELPLALLLEQSDIISIHAPLNDFSKNLITFEKLQRMKKTALLINTGRGGIVVEQDVVRALKEDIISGYATDVFDKEPVSTENPLLEMSDSYKLLLLPHIAWASVEARSALVKGIYKNIAEFKEDLLR